MYTNRAWRCGDCSTVMTRLTVQCNIALKARAGGIYLLVSSGVLLVLHNIEFSKSVPNSCTFKHMSTMKHPPKFVQKYPLYFRDL